MSQSTLVKMPHCWKSHVAADMHFDLKGAYLRRLPDLQIG